MRSAVFIVMVLVLAGAPEVWAQRTSASSVEVTVLNRGIFECALNVSIFNFGNVDSDGTDYSFPNVVAYGRNATDDGGDYENAPGSITWTCRAAPVSSVDLSLTSTTDDHLGGIDADHLEVRIQDTAGGTSTGYQAFTSEAALITGVGAGNGANAASGDLDLHLMVLDSNVLGFSVWVVQLRAAGNP